jgi:hypothetical protein
VVDVPPLRVNVSVPGFAPTSAAVSSVASTETVRGCGGWSRVAVALVPAAQIVPPTLL